MITDSPVNIENQPVVIEFQKPLTAITSGAHIQLNVSNSITAENMVEAFEEIENEFPSGCVTGSLNAKDIEGLDISQMGESWGGKDQVYLKLSSTLGVPTDTAYESIVIKSCREITGTDIVWYNHSK